MAVAVEVEDAQVSVRVASFTQLCADDGLPLAIDTYQRGFVWDEGKIEQLAADLTEYQRLPHPKPPYYMGALLLHQSAERGRRFVIDGQQRLTALFVLHHVLQGSLPSSCEMNYTPASAQRIRRAMAAFREYGEALRPEVLNGIAFTVISVHHVDLAFAFFDTQNNRGVRLHATDLLKAFHLRSIEGAETNARDRLQDQSARGWERVQQGHPVLSGDDGFTAALFARFLWRGRRWSGRSAVPAGHDSLLREFEQHAYPPAADGSMVPLYAAHSNRRANWLRLDGEGGVHTQNESETPATLPHELPFALRQPVHRGVGFFLYTEKYAALLRWLVVNPEASQEVKRAREVFHKLLGANSLYLREIWLLGLVSFADRFGDDQLFEFSLWLEYALGAVRLEKTYVREETAQNFFAKADVNLLDAIASAFHPEQVIGRLRDNAPARAIYRSDAPEESAGGVRATYRRAVRQYFGRQDASLADKAQWIRQSLRSEP